MSEDRELLELAAKAVGIPITPDCHIPSGGIWISNVDVDQTWSPLNDDGDALRLAVSIPALDLHWVVAKAWQFCDSEEERRSYVRRSIVCAAAEIGRFLP